MKVTPNIAASVERVFKTRDADNLSKEAYKFITLHMGFIAHFDRNGFVSTYRDLRDLARNLQTSEYSSDPSYNVEWADELERREGKGRQAGDGYENGRQLAEAIREIVCIARRYTPDVEQAFGAAQRESELNHAAALAKKHGYTLVSKS